MPRPALSVDSSTSSDQKPNVFVERALTYTLGYLLQAEGARGGESQAFKEVLRDAGDRGRLLAIKLRADNDFYSQTSQVRQVNRSPWGHLSQA